MKTFQIHPIRHDQITSWDIQNECGGIPLDAYTVTIFGEDGHALSGNRCEAVYIPSKGCAGICNGGETAWGDANSIEEAVELWLNQPAAWETRN